MKTRTIHGMKVTTGSDNVFRDLGFGKAEAENLKLRSDLMIRVVKFVKQSGMTQARAARELGITQPRLNPIKHDENISTIPRIAAISDPRHLSRRRFRAAQGLANAPSAPWPIPTRCSAIPSDLSPSSGQATAHR